jgi:tetratricopeptide (TPR) repeat protein
MKQIIIKLTLFILLIVGGNACNDFLDIYNPSAVTDEFYDTKDGQQRLLYSMYARYRTHYSTCEPMYFGTDLYMSVSQTPVELMFDAYDKSFNSTAPVVSDLWNNLYKIIQEGNTLLERISPDEEGMTADEYTSMVAQAKFLRAMAYYYLVETFGPVPLLLAEVHQSVEEVTRMSEDIIYGYFIYEMENDVVNKLENSTTEHGKLTNAAAWYFLGKLYLTRAYKTYAEPDDFAKAVECFDEIINDPVKTYDLLPTFADVFDENNQGNKEIIWAVQYSTDKNYNGDGNPLHAMFGFNITALHPNDFIENQQDYSAMQRGYWINPRTHELFDNVADSRYEATFQFEFTANNPASSKFGQVAIQFPKWNDPAQGVPNPADGYYPFKDAAGDYHWYAQDSYLPVLTKASDHMPIVKKFRDTKIDWNGSGSREAVVFRVADTYLLAAEAYLGAGNTPKALERINVVRKRAATNASTQSLMELNQIDLDIILDERGRELLGEFDRWFDLKRTGKLIERVKSYNIKAVAANNLNEKYLVRPIPQDEINKVKGLEQNEAYK